MIRSPKSPAQINAEIAEALRLRPSAENLPQAVSTPTKAITISNEDVRATARLDLQRAQRAQRALRLDGNQRYLAATILRLCSAEFAR